MSKTLKQTTLSGHINSWIVAERKLSGLVWNGRMWLSQSVKSAVIPTRTCSHRGFRLINTRGQWINIPKTHKAYYTKRGYRVLVHTISNGHYLALAWVQHMTSLSLEQLKERHGMSPSISLRTIYLRPNGRQAGNVSVIPIIFPSGNGLNRKPSSCSKEPIGST